MAGENLKAFENLKENKNASLNSQEKADLRNISLRDIQSQKEKIGNKTFLIGSESMKLKDIVNSLVFDEKGNRAQIKMRDNSLVTIGWGSELGAAIQVYAIANNKSIGDSGIDGMVGKNTVKGLQSTQNAVRAEGRKNPETLDDQDEVKEQSVARLVNAIYTEYVGKYSNESYNLLDTRSGVNQGTLKNKTVDGNKVTITYKSAIGKKGNQVIVVDASTCKVGRQYSVDRFGKAIEDAISRKEADLQKKENERIAKENMDRTNNNAKDGIESFDKNGIIDPIVKKRAELKDIDFKCDSWGNGRIQIRAVSGGKNLKQIMRNNTDVLTNGSFDAVKFNNILNKQCYNVALAAVKQYVKDGNKATPGALKYKSEIDRELKNCDGLLREIDKWGHKSDLAPVRKEVSDKKETIKNQDAYLSEKGKLEDALDKIDDLAGRNNKDFVDNFDKIMAEMKKVAVINKVGGARYTYNVDYATTGRVKFNAVGKKAEYTRMVDNMVNKWRSIRYGGDPMYTVNVVGR